MLPEGIMLERTLGADRAGLQVMIHAIGDAANQQVLDIFAAVAEANGPRDRRCRVEHAQHLRREDIARFGNLGVIASMQPYHAADDGRWCEKRLGRERCAQAYAFRSLLDTGAVLAFGSDWTVAPLNPLTGIKASVTRQTLDGKNPDGWVPEEKITVEEAVRAYTMGSAFAEFAEHQKGSLVPGKLADFVILEEDIFAMDPSGIDRVRVLCTVVGGRVVHEI
jgi:predicted amidohydrolase YtcJ